MAAILDDSSEWATTTAGVPDATLLQGATQRLSEADWQRILAVLPKKTATRARHFPRTRSFVEATLWVVDTGLQWRQLPADYGSWRANYVHFLRWAQQGTWAKITAAIGDLALGTRLQGVVDDYLFESDAHASARARSD